MVHPQQTPRAFGKKSTGNVKESTHFCPALLQDNVACARAGRMHFSSNVLALLVSLTSWIYRMLHNLLHMHLRF